MTTTDDTALQDWITKAVERVTCSRWEDKDDCATCDSSMVTCRHSSYMYCDAHDTMTKPGDRCPHASEIATAVLPIVEAEVRKAKAEVLREAAEDVTEIDGRRDDSAANWLRARATEYETGASDEHR